MLALVLSQECGRMVNGMVDIIDEYIEHARNYYAASRAAHMIWVDFPDGAHETEGVLSAANKYTQALVDYALSEQTKFRDLAMVIRKQSKGASAEPVHRNPEDAYREGGRKE